MSAKNDSYIMQTYSGPSGGMIRLLDSQNNEVIAVETAPGENDLRAMRIINAEIKRRNSRMHIVRSTAGYAPPELRAPASYLHEKKEIAIPPTSGEYLLHLFLPREQRESLVGDLVEEYGELVVAIGPRWARIWFWRQVYTSIVPAMRLRMRDVFIVGWAANRLANVVHRTLNLIGLLFE